MTRITWALFDGPSGSQSQTKLSGCDPDFLIDHVLIHQNMTLVFSKILVANKAMQIFKELCNYDQLYQLCTNTHAIIIGIFHVILHYLKFKRKLQYVGHIWIAVWVKWVNRCDRLSTLVPIMLLGTKVASYVAPIYYYVVFTFRPKFAWLSLYGRLSSHPQIN